MTISKQNILEPTYAYESFSGCDMVCTMNYKTPEGFLLGPIALGSLQTLSYSIHQEPTPVRVVGNLNAKDYVFGPRTIAGSLVFAVFNKHWAIDIMEEYAKQGCLGSTHFLLDEIPPFDITVTYANEYGKTARMALYGIKIIDEGMVMSINDVYTENTYQFVATNIDYLADIAHFTSTNEGKSNQIGFNTNIYYEDFEFDTDKTTEENNLLYINIPNNIEDLYNGDNKDECLKSIEREREQFKSEMKQKYNNNGFATEEEYRQAITLIDIKCNRLIKAAIQKYDT